MADETLGQRAAEPENTDLTLGQATPDEDVPAPVTDVPETDYDFGALASGARANRHVVRPAMRGDLLGAMEQIVNEVEDAEKAGDSDLVDELAERYEQVKADFEGSRATVIVEGRSSARRQQVMKRLEKLGITQPGKKASAEDQAEYAREVLLHQLADQIIYPRTGVSVDALRDLLEANEPALNLIWQAGERANSSAAKVPVAPDFLRGR